MCVRGEREVYVSSINIRLEKKNKGSKGSYCSEFLMTFCTVTLTFKSADEIQ